MNGRFTLTCMIGLSLVTLAVPARADDATGLKTTTPEQRADYQTGLLKDLLSLTPDQVAKVAALNLEYAQQFDPILKGDMGRYAKYKQATALLAAKDAAIKPLLTDAQYQKYLDTKKTVQNDLETHFADHRAPSP
jgi:hypothetical protein